MLLTTSQAAQELGCAVTTFRRLARTGALPGLSRRGVRTVVPWEVVTALRERPEAPLGRHLPGREVAVLRVDAAQPVAEDDRGWIGFSTALPPEDLIKALRGWWRCDAASVAAAGVLPVTVAGFVVAVLTGLDTWERDGRGRSCFTNARLAGYVTDLATPHLELTAASATDRALAQALLATRLPSHSGGAIAYVTTPPTDRAPHQH
ncbi:helix-turn-helix domain-containing protein [Streptomyces mangrovi]|uniref:helix-turn-helix domain-containing protein n=1 Tax=Streptomyces mangrovi TaxID=1206892 RepID=UPI00399CA018